MNDIAKVWWHELGEVFHDGGIIIFVIILPLFYPLLYAIVYGTEVARDVPIAIVDDSHTALSRSFVRAIDACPETQVFAKCANMSDARHLLMKRDVYGIVHIPTTFESDIRDGRQTYVGAYSDVSSMIYYKNLLLPCTNVSLEFNRNIKIDKLSSAMSDREQAVAKMPIDYQHVMLYNPQGGFDSFILPPVLMLIVQQAMLLGIGMAMGRVRENNHGYAVPQSLSTVNPLKIIFGKLFFYVPLFVVLALYMHIGVTHMFRLPELGHYLTAIAFLIPYVVACCLLGLSLSAFLYRREDTILLFVFMSVPLLFLSGVSWPGSNMPLFWKIFGSIFPSTYGLPAYVRISSMGATISDVSPEMIHIWILIAVYFIISCIFTSRQMSRIRRQN